QRQSVLQPKVFAVTGGVLADERNLAYSVPRQPLSFRDYGFKVSRTKFTPQLRDDAEAARMITALGNLDVRRCFRRRKHARRVFVIEVIRQIGNSAVPFRAGKASALLARQPFRPSWYAGFQCLAGRIGIENDKRRTISRRPKACLNPGRSQDMFQLARAHHCIHFRDIFLYLVSIALNQAAGDYPLFRSPCAAPSQGWYSRIPVWPNQ